MGKRNGNIMEGVNLFKVHGTCVWDYPNEITLYYLYMINQKNKKLFKRIEG
jgi:hypothetical protein